MTLLKNPNEINEMVTLAGIVYRQPGVGKLTLALSAPNPVLIDADKGHAPRREEVSSPLPSAQ
jgi:hypothetical protein